MLNTLAAGFRNSERAEEDKSSWLLALETSGIRIHHTYLSSVSEKQGRHFCQLLPAVACGGLNYEIILIFTKILTGVSCGICCTWYIMRRKKPSRQGVTKSEGREQGRYCKSTFVWS